MAAAKNLLSSSSALIHSESLNCRKEDDTTSPGDAFMHSTPSFTINCEGCETLQEHYNAMVEEELHESLHHKQNATAAVQKNTELYHHEQQRFRRQGREMIELRQALADSTRALSEIQQRRSHVAEKVVAADESLTDDVSLVVESENVGPTKVREIFLKAEQPESTKEAMCALTEAQARSEREAEAAMRLARVVQSLFSSRVPEVNEACDEIRSICKCTTPTTSPKSISQCRSAASGEFEPSAPAEYAKKRPAALRDSQMKRQPLQARQSPNEVHGSPSYSTIAHSPRRLTGDSSIGSPISTRHLSGSVVVRPGW